MAESGAIRSQPSSRHSLTRQPSGTDNTINYILINSIHLHLAQGAWLAVTVKPVTVAVVASSLSIIKFELTKQVAMAHSINGQVNHSIVCHIAANCRPIRRRRNKPSRVARRKSSYQYARLPTARGYKSHSNTMNMHPSTHNHVKCGPALSYSTLGLQQNKSTTQSLRHLVTVNQAATIRNQRTSFVRRQRASSDLFAHVITGTGHPSIRQSVSARHHGHE